MTVLLNLWHMRMVGVAANTAKDLLAQNTAVANDKLDDIRDLVNGSHHEALQTIRELKALLLLALSEYISPDDPRIKEVLARADLATVF